MNHLALVGPLGGAVVSAIVSFLVFVVLARQKEKRDRALDLLREFMADESFVKARLVTQEYLVENGSRFNRVRGLNFYRLDLHLAASDDPSDREARILIRMVTSFFWLVNQAKESGHICGNETIFSEMYSWYWVFVYQERIRGCEDGRQFREFKWMGKKTDLEACRMERDRMIDAVKG